MALAGACESDHCNRDRLDQQEGGSERETRESDTDTRVVTELSHDSCQCQCLRVFTQWVHTLASLS